MTTKRVPRRANFSWLKCLKSNMTLCIVIALARLDARGVHYKAQRSLKSILGSRYSSLVSYARSNFGRRFLSSIWAWNILLPGTIAFFLYLSNISENHLRLSEDVLSDSFSVFSPVPLALVGLVIPFLALAVSVVYSKMGSGAVAYAMKHNRVIRLVYSALIILGLLVALQLLLNLSETMLGKREAAELISSVGWLMAFLGAWWVIYLICVAGIGVASVLAVFSPVKALKTITQEIVTESMRTFRREFDDSLSLKALEDILSGSYFEVGYFQPSDGDLVTTNKVGSVVNISCWGLLKINSVIVPAPSSFLKVVLTKPYYYIAPRDSQIAGIRGDLFEDISLPMLKRAIRSCYRIRKPRTEKDKLYEALEHYKEIMNSFLKGDNEDFVRIALDGYGEVLRKYISLDLKLSAKDSPGAFGDWRPIMLVLDALNKAVVTVVSTSDAKNVSMVAHWIKVMMQECIDRQEEYIFSRLLSLYRTMFYHASRSNNTIGIHRSHFEPIQLLDFDIFRFGKTETVLSNEVAFRCRLARLIVEHLSHLLRDSLDINDPDTVAEMLLRLQPKELFGYFHPDLSFDCFEVERRLKHDALGNQEIAVLEDQRKSCNILESFKSDSRQWHIDILHNSLMYLIDKIDHKAIKINAVEQVISKIWSNFPDWPQTVDWLERYNVGRQIFEERLWEFWPESRRPQSRNPMAAPILLFTIRGLFLQSQSAAPLDIPGSRTIDGFCDQVVAVARSIQSSSDWNVLTGVVSREVLSLFEQSLNTAKQRYNDDVAEAVKASSLSGEKIADFKHKIRESYDDASILRHIISQSKITNSDEYNIYASQTIYVHQKPFPKEAFIDQKRISYVGFGENEGRALAREIDEYIWRTIRNSLADQRIIELKANNIDALDTILKQFSEQDRSSLCMVFSGRSQIRFDLWSAEKFTPSWKIGRQEQKGFYGEYDGIPVYTAIGSIIDGIMIFLKGDVAFEELQEPIVSVEEFTDDQRKDLAARAGITEEKLKEEVFVRIHVTLALAISKVTKTVILSLGQN